MPSFELAKSYAKTHGLIDSSSQFAQGVTALKSLVSPRSIALFDWSQDRDSQHFDHTRVFTKSPNAKTKAWQVAFSPYRMHGSLGRFQEVADALDIEVIIGDPAHKTYDHDDTVPVMFFRRF